MFDLRQRSGYLIVNIGATVTRRFAALFILFSFLFVSIVHACSGLDSMQVASLHNSSENPMGGKPCDQSKQENDICKSIRYRMLSVRAEPVQNDWTVLAATLPHVISSDDLLPLIASFSPRLWTDSLPFSKMPRHLSLIVLRI
jgi:hypothetical protein